MELVLERREQENRTPEFGGVVAFTPPINKDYWAYRVRLSETQAILGFPKFSTIGIGFAVEEYWNTNLPYFIGTEKIWKHIAHNKGDESISDEDCILAIEMVRMAAGADLAHQLINERNAALDKHEALLAAVESLAKWVDKAQDWVLLQTEVRDRLLALVKL